MNPEIARFEADLRPFATLGASVTRYNLAQEPGEFVARPVVAAMLKPGGQDVLPIVLVDGKLAFSGSWPSRTDLAAPLGVQDPAVGTDLPAPVEQSAPPPRSRSPRRAAPPPGRRVHLKAAGSGRCC